jgi:adenylosuccinate lyase
MTMKAASRRYEAGDQSSGIAPTTERRDNFDYLSPLDTRYYGADSTVYENLHPYLSEAASIRYQVKVEQAIVATLEETGVAPRGISRRLASAVADITPEAIYEEESKTHHNIRALVNCLRRGLPEAFQGYVHLFATSADVLDTARSLQFRDFTRERLLPEIRELIGEITSRARLTAEMPQIGRTHGRYAEPITVGYWLSNFVARLVQRAEKISETAAELRGMYSGAVGAHSALALQWPENPSAIEASMLERLGLKPGDGSVSTQVIQPEYLTDYAHALVSYFGVLANIADDFRHLMRNEIDEIEDGYDVFQVGSSTMPHKVNPKNFENVKSLWKTFFPRMITCYMDQISEHQRDLTNSASMRFFNELAAAAYYATYRLKDAIKRTTFREDMIERNLKDSYDLIIAEPLYISFALAGRPDAYESLRTLAVQAREARKSGRRSSIFSLLEADLATKKIWDGLPKRIQEIILEPRKYVGDSAQRTHLVCDDAEQRLKGKIFDRLWRPAESESLVVQSIR